MFVEHNPHTANTDHLRSIYSQRVDGCEAYFGQPNDGRAIDTPTKVIVPHVFMRVKERCVIGAMSSIRLVTITRGTRKAEVAKIGFTASCPWNDMLDFESRDS